MRSEREKRFEDANDLQYKMETLKGVYQNKMIVTPEHNEELKSILNNLREELNASVIKAFDYIDSITIGNETLNQKIASFAYMLGNRAEENGQEGDMEIAEMIFEDEQKILEYLSGGDITKAEVLELYKYYNEGKTLDEGFNSVNIFGYQFINMYGKDINKEEYVKVIKRIYSQARILVKEHNKEVFNIAVNEGSGLLAVLALHQLKLKFPQVKINICLPFDGCIGKWGYESRNLYKQLEHTANRITYIDEELRVYPRGVYSDRLQAAFMDYFSRSAKTSIAIYTPGCKGEKITEEFLNNANENGSKLYYIEI